MARHFHQEENFQEATREIHRLFLRANITPELRDTIAAIRARTLLAHDSHHTLLCAALGQYLDHHKFPPLESLPDMHSTSEYFLRLQEVFRDQAQVELKNFLEILRIQLLVCLLDTISNNCDKNGFY
jgi:NEDD8-activating enzyme E1 regulatory subunit